MTPAASAVPPDTTVVRDGSTITGSITGARDVVVEGQVDGDIEVEGSVTIAAAGAVRGNIQAHTVAVSGSLKGNIVAAKRVQILATGSLTGDIAAAGLAISDGAALNGKVQIEREASGISGQKTGSATPAKGDSGNPR